MPVDEIKSGTHLIMEAMYDTGYNSRKQDEISKSKAAISYISREFGFGKSTNADISNSPECGRIKTGVNFDKKTNGLNISCGKGDAETAFAMFYNYIYCT